MSAFKPMLAVAANLDKLTFPALVSPKLDGIRCLIKDGQVLSRSLKPIPNAFVREKLAQAKYEGLDGELIVGEPSAPDVYRTTNSGVMSQEGEPNFKFHVFDRHDLPSFGFLDRYHRIPKDDQWITKVPHHHVSDMDALLKLEEIYLNMGYEGLMLRHPNLHYKFGRSTEREGILLKLKRYVDAEYKVIGFEERMHNGNVATTNALGHTERSSHKENLIGRGDLGALVLEHPDGFTFNTGSGFDDELRAEIWNNRDKYLGQFAKVKYFAIGVKDKPRFPVFLGFRDERDM